MNTKMWATNEFYFPRSNTQDIDIHHRTNFIVTVCSPRIPRRKLPEHDNHRKDTWHYHVECFEASNTEDSALMRRLTQAE